jgi:hypothetical protein
VNLVPLVFSSGWASGVNAYLVVLVLGLSDRWGHFEQIPDQLARTDVLVAAAVLFVGEFVVDKVPYLDSTWDAISTVIRPTVAAVIALLVSGEATNLEQAAYAVLGGGTALASHSVKAGSRLAINASPEPFSNWTASLAEDGLVVAVVLLVINHPWLALTITVVLLVAGLSLLFWLMGRIRRGWRRWKGRTVRSTA